MSNYTEPRRTQIPETHTLVKSCVRARVRACSRACVRVARSLPCRHRWTTRELRGWYEGDMCFAVAVTLYSSFIIARLVGYRAHSWTRFAKRRCVSTNGNRVDLNPAIRPSFTIIAFLRQGRCLFLKKKNTLRFVFYTSKFYYNYTNTEYIYRKKYF